MLPAQKQPNAIENEPEALPGQEIPPLSQNLKKQP